MSGFHRTSLPTGLLLTVLLTVAWPAADSAAQDAPSLANLARKDAPSAADREAIRAALSPMVKRLESAAPDKEKDRAQARDALVKELAQGTNGFREAAAKEAAVELTRLVRMNLEVAHDAALVLTRLDHPAVSAALTEALQSRFAAVRYQAARGVRSLHPRLKSPDAHRPLIFALADAGERETDVVTRRMIYQALDFANSDAKFGGVDDVAEALGRVLAARLKLAQTRDIDAAEDAAAFQAAFRLGGTLKNPPVKLVAGLAGMLQVFARQSLSDRASVRMDAAADCETALYRIIEKHGVRTNDLARVQDLLRSGADEKALREALRKLYGGGGQRGALNAAPWNLPPGLGSGEKS